MSKFTFAATTLFGNAATDGTTKEVTVTRDGKPEKTRVHEVTVYFNSSNPEEKSQPMTVVAWGNSFQNLIPAVKAGDTIAVVGEVRATPWYSEDNHLAAMEAAEGQQVKAFHGVTYQVRPSSILCQNAMERLKGAKANGTSSPASSPEKASQLRDRLRKGKTEGEKPLDAVAAAAKQVADRKAKAAAKAAQQTQASGSDDLDGLE